MYKIQLSIKTLNFLLLLDTLLIFIYACFQITAYWLGNRAIVAGLKISGRVPFNGEFYKIRLLYGHVKIRTIC
ncbi:Uncharacterized protein dnm_084640 [Desulfonema magnum]|uniref:Uncharacterized protein n=1 Tax=Desulfonema magnum TaxID=45655 RepID=A0A975GST3_9BACT|nr:Uncharacterized protein dnm_084640 [Desulfonema magnum]